MKWMIAAVSGALLAAAATMVQAQPARGGTAPVRTQPSIIRPAELARLRALQTRPAPQPSCPESALVADVVALDHPMVFNRIGAQNINWMMYALRHDVIDVRSRHVLDDSPKGRELFEAARSRNDSRGIALRPDLRPRPLVLRVAAGQYLQVRFTNLLSTAISSSTNLPGNPNRSSGPVFPGLDHPLDHAPRDPSGMPEIFQIDDQVASRTVGFHPQGLELVGNIHSDSSFVGTNGNSLAAPGQSRSYCFFAPAEGAFLVTNTGAVFGGEGTAGNSGVGLFATVAVQPAKARFYRAQVTEEELRLATRSHTPGGQPVIDYDATYPDDCATSGVWCSEGKAGLPILNMMQGQRIVHGDINAIIIGPNKDGSFPASTYPLESKGLRNPSLPNRLEPFREFVSVYHDENAATQAFPYFFEHPELRHTLHGVRDAFMINYGSGGIGSEIIANRLQAGPMQDCLDCAYEEFFLSAFAVGDAAMLVDKPVAMAVGRCQPEFVDAQYRKSKGRPFDASHYDGFLKHCDWKGMGKDVQATQAWYPHDPANVHHSYIGDAVKFRNVHAGKEQHVFHLHNHQWLFNPNDDNSNYIDAQAIGPGSGYTYEIAFGGSGNRNKTVGDAIFHCHFYPHFAQGMWYMWRVHDVLETGTRLAVTDEGGDFHAKPFGLKNGRPAEKARALPDGELVAGAPIPAIVPLPGKALPLVPAPVHVTPKATGFGSKAELLKPDEPTNPGYPFWIAGVTEHKDTPASIGHRPTTPPLDMDKNAGGFDGGLPRHALAGYAEGGHSEALLTRLTAEKHLEAAKPIYFPESGTPLERLAMKFHAQRDHPSHKVDMGGNVSPASFTVNGAPPVPGAPYNEPCIDDRGKLLQTGDGGGRFFGGGSLTSLVPVSDSLPGGIQFGADKPRVYKGANLQLDVVFNKLGYHYPQQRILSLWEDVVPTLDRKRPPEPLVLRMNTFDCAMYWHTNLVPKDFYADDYQITTPTDVIGQHIHLPKWDLTSADGGANGWNYEDGTFSPGAVRERIAAINSWNSHATAPVPQPGGSTAPLVPAIHPYFNASIGHQKDQCDRIWLDLGGDFAAFEKEYGAHPGICDWLGARTTLQRWFSDPVLNTKNVHRGLGITFTHDHLGPSTHQQLGLYATMLTEPPGAEWRHNETGVLLGTRGDGGPTSWQAIITGKDRTPLYVDRDDRLDDSHREFFLQFGDFQHAYEKGTYVGVSAQGVPYKYDPSATAGPDSYRKAIHPSVRKPVDDLKAIFKYENDCPGGDPDSALDGSVYSATTAPPRPCPEAISADDVGMMVVNYRNEPVSARVYDPRSTSQASGFRGDLAYAFQTRTDRAIGDLNTELGSTPYPPLTAHIHKGDPFTPILRAYSGDLVRVKVQAGSHEHEHNGSINGLAWLQGGSGYGQAPDSGWRNAQNTGLSEQFTFAARITDYVTRNNLTDRMYTVETAQDGIWNGVWGVLRSDNRLDRDDRLQTLPGNPRPTLLAPWQGQVSLNDCPKGARVRRYDVSAVLANRVLDNPLGIAIPTPSGSALDGKGGTLTYNPRDAAIIVQVFDDKGNHVGNRKYHAGPLHDPTAILFVRSEDLDQNGYGALKPGRPIEPLVLRAAAGECVQIVLHNRLPRGRKAMPDLDGYTSLTGIIRDQGGSPGSGDATSFNNNDIRPSHHIGLHPQMVHYDVQDYDGSAVGVNHVSTIAPGMRQMYQWYAGNVDMVGSAESCPLDDTATAAAYNLLNQFPDKPTLRSVSHIYDRDAFTEILHALINPEQKLLGEEPDALTRELAASMATKTPAQCFEDPTASGARVTGASPFARLPAAMRIASARAVIPRADDAVDEAPLLDATAMVDRQTRLQNRLACADNTGLVAIYQRDLQNALQDEAKAAEVANALVRSFAYELPQVDNDAPFSESFAWREEKYPGLTPDTTRLARLDKLCRFNAIEYGGSNLTPPDRVKQGQKAAVGALVVEPKGARWSEYYDDTGIDRHNPGTSQGNMRPTRATATVHYPIAGTGGKWMRDVAVVQQKGLNFRYGSRESGGGPVPNLAAERENNAQNPQHTAPEDAHDSGHMAVNYGSEPMWYRFGLEPDAPFGAEGFAGVTHAWQAFSNSCCSNGGTALVASAPLGEPYVPIFATANGMETRLRLLLPTGVGRGTTLTLHGHAWARDPYLAENVSAGGWPVGGSHATWGTPSQCLGNNPMHMTMGGQESQTPMAHFEMLLPSAGNRVSGDYLLRDIGGFGITSGIWALLRVTGNPASALALRSDCR